MAKPRLRISADIGMLFAEQPLPERIAAAAEAGFDGVDVALPYDHPAPELRDKAVFAGIPFLRIDAPPPNYTGGAPGYAAMPACADRFRRDLTRVLRHAQVLGVNRVHLRAGLEGADRTTLIDNLTWASAQAPKTMLLIEALNPRDHPDHCLADTAAAVAVINEVGAPNLRLLFSTWHAARNGKLADAWHIAAPVTGHVLLGGGDATQSDHDAAEMIDLARDSAFDGWLCASYAPQSTTLKSLGWLPSKAKGK